MSENKLSDEEQALQSLAFVHQILTSRTKFYAEEFKAADQALKFIISLAEQIDEKLKKESEESSEKASEPQGEE